MALGSYTIWGSAKSLLTQIFGNKVRTQRIHIGGSDGAFGTYATGGVTYNIPNVHGYSTNGVRVKLEGNATYTFVYNKATGKILFMNTVTGVQESALTDISGVEIYGTLIGR